MNAVAIVQAVRVVVEEQRVAHGARSAADACLTYLASLTTGNGPDLAALRELSVAVDEALDLADPVEQVLA